MIDCKLFTIDHTHRPKSYINAQLTFLPNYFFFHLFFPLIIRLHLQWLVACAPLRRKNVYWCLTTSTHSYMRFRSCMYPSAIPISFFAWLIAPLCIRVSYVCLSECVCVCITLPWLYALTFVRCEVKERERARRLAMLTNNGEFASC